MLQETSALVDDLLHGAAVYQDGRDRRGQGALPVGGDVLRRAAEPQRVDLFRARERAHYDRDVEAAAARVDHVLEQEGAPLRLQ